MEYFFGAPDTPVLNVSPTWAVDTPATLNFPSGGGTYNFGSKAIDPQPWDTLYFQLNPGGQKPLGYDINSSSGVLTVLNGSPNAAIVVRVSDNEFAYADHACSVSLVSNPQPQPATFIIPVAPSTARTFDASLANGFGGQPWRTVSNVTRTADPTTGLYTRPGDIIEFANGTHASMTFRNIIANSETAPITLRGPTTGTEPAIFRRPTPTFGSDFILLFEHCHDVYIDGYNPEIGAGAKNFGCGIKVMYAASGRSNSSKESFAGMIMLTGSTNAPPSGWPRTTVTDHIKIRYVEIDGGYVASRDTNSTTFADTAACLTANPGIGIQHNDHAVLAKDNTGRYKEKIIVEHCYIHNCRTESLYLGPNWFDQSNTANYMEPPIKGAIVRYNRIEDSGWDACNAKQWWARPTTNVTGSFLDAPLGWNLVHDNIVHRAAQNPGGGSVDNSGAAGLPILWCTVDVFNNIVIDAGGQGIFLWSNIPAGVIGNGYPNLTDHPCNVYNNLVVGAGWAADAADPNGDRPVRGIYVSSGSITMSGRTYNNTIVGTKQAANYTGTEGTNYAGYALTLGTGQVGTNNILINNALGYNLNGGSQSNNWLATGQILSDVFEIPGVQFSETYDYHIKAAVNIASKALGCTSPYPTTDLEGDTKSTTSTSATKGAYEYAAVYTRQGIFATFDFETGYIKNNGQSPDGLWVKAMEDSSYANASDFGSNSSNTSLTFGPSSDYDVRVVTSKTVPSNPNGAGGTCYPRSGSYFLETRIYKTKDYSLLNDAAAPNDPVLDKPRCFAAATNDNWRWNFDEEIWIGFSIFLPQNLEHDLGLMGDRRAGNWLHSILGIAGGADSSMLNLGYYCPSGINVSHWWMQGATNASSHLEGQPGGTYDDWNLGSVVDDLGKWTDWVYRLRINPFTTTTTLYGQTFVANTGIREIWKSTGAVLPDGNRVMTKISNIIGSDGTSLITTAGRVGLRPGVAGDQIQFNAPRQYKFGWKKNPTTVVGPIFIGFDSVRIGRASNNAGFRDVHPTTMVRP